MVFRLKSKDSPSMIIPRSAPVQEQKREEVVVETKFEKQQPKELFEVVIKLPMQEIRRYKRDDGVIVNLITVEEALTQIANGELE